MSVAAVFLVKDEVDIIEPVVRHMLAQVDEILVADNGSTDGTAELLHSILDSEGPGFMQLLVDDDPAYYQAEKTTALAMRALERGHAWVIPCDADEWWYAPDGRRLADWLAGVPRDQQFIKTVFWNHLPTALDEGGDPIDRIRWRQREHPDQKWWKVACRLRPDLQIHQGNHSASTSGTGMTGYGLALRHFPWRSPGQYVKKIRNGWNAYAATNLPEDVGGHWRMHGDPADPTFEERVTEHFYEWFFPQRPAEDTSLVEDPAPRPVLDDVKVPG